MMNYACDFSQSETEKYFEWVIKVLLKVAILTLKILHGLSPDYLKQGDL